MTKKNKEVATVQGTETQVKETGLVIAQAYEFGGVSITKEEFDSLAFEDASGELLSKELLESVLNVEVDAILSDKQKVTIKGEEKDFITVNILTNEGVRTVLAGQYKFIEVYDRFNKGNGVAVRFTFEGLKKIKDSAKTVNSFKFLAKSL